MAEVKIKLNEEQKEAFKALQKFVEHPAANTFVLKGYAGTGKTFLMQHFANWLNEKKHKFSMLASTGRAATVLRGKTGFVAKTVHGELYQFHKVEGDEEDLPEDATIDQYGQMYLQFLLRQPDQGKKIYIVDESSMLSSESSDNPETVAFGSGYLMSDFFSAVENNKIIFVGDPGQLNPVGQLLSPALDMEWLAQQQRIAISVTLEKIERQDPNNDILVLASMIRNMINSPAIKYPKLPASNFNNVKIYSTQKELFQKYVEKFKEVGPSGTLAIARTNKMVNDINRAFRRDQYGELDLPIQPGEILMVVQNNYAVPLANGDFVIVQSFGETEVQAELYFQKICVKAIASENEYELLLSLDVLNSTNGNLTRVQSKRLMVDFSRRMKRKGFKANSEEYKDAMMDDIYLNSLKAKFGYAVTCHKAQGGEWDHVYLFLEKGMYIMARQELFRWWYTATTRAKKMLNISRDWWIV